MRLIEYLNTEDHKALLYDLVEEASAGHPDIQLVRDTILSLPKEWLIENIEAPIQKVLSNEGDEEYKRLIELCISIDNSLVERLCKQALAHSNNSYEDWLIDYLSKLEILTVEPCNYIWSKEISKYFTSIEKVKYELIADMKDVLTEYPTSN